MKRILIVCYAVFIALAMRAQSFSWTDAAGATFDITITDAANKYAKVTHGEAATGATEITVPGSVQYNGDTYTVTDVAGRVTNIKGQYSLVGLKKVILSEGIKIIRFHSTYLARDVEEIVFPSTLEVIEQEACTFLSLKNIDLSHTRLRFIGAQVFNTVEGYGTIESIKFPQTLRRIDGGIMMSGNHPLKDMVLPAQLDTIAYSTFLGLAQLETLTFEKPTPALLYNPYPLNPSYGPYDLFQENTNLRKIYVPVDAAKAYMDAPWWALPASKYREQLTIGATGYTTYYLENENFKVPAGCTAYIITGVTPSGSITTPDQAIVKAFTAGKIIPKKTGFILQGTPNTTVEYQANVTGTEENVTGNLLVGTATEQEISGAGYKYYIFSASGDQGLGFYKQGTRQGASIKLKPHRAGLRLDESIGRAKSLIFDFDAARREAETTGIHGVRPEMQRRDNAVYDLQGRRVVNPTHGIYIINGKKIIK